MQVMCFMARFSGFVFHLAPRPPPRDSRESPPSWRGAPGVPPPRFYPGEGARAGGRATQRGALRSIAPPVGGSAGQRGPNSKELLRGSDRPVPGGTQAAPPPLLTKASRWERHVWDQEESEEQTCF